MNSIGEKGMCECKDGFENVTNLGCLSKCRDELNTEWKGTACVCIEGMKKKEGVCKDKCPDELANSVWDGAKCSCGLGYKDDEGVCKDKCTLADKFS